MGPPPWSGSNESDVSEAPWLTWHAPFVVVSSPPKSESSSRLRSSAFGATIVVAAHRRGRARPFAPNVSQSGEQARGPAMPVASRRVEGGDAPHRLCGSSRSNHNYVDSVPMLSYRSGTLRQLSDHPATISRLRVCHSKAVLTDVVNVDLWPEADQAKRRLSVDRQQSQRCVRRIRRQRRGLTTLSPGYMASMCLIVSGRTMNGEIGHFIVTVSIATRQLLSGLTGIHTHRSVPSSSATPWRHQPGSPNPGPGEDADSGRSWR